MTDINSEMIADMIINKWEGTRMIESNFGEPKELLEDLKKLIVTEIDKLKNKI